jgi:hypothetical protein
MHLPLTKPTREFTGKGRRCAMLLRKAAMGLVILVLG